MNQKNVAIIGRPNVGKSTLFNRLAGKSIAIETKIPGTTRDRLYAEIGFGNFSFCLTDLAGFAFDLKSELDRAIQEGTRLAMENADLILFLVDWEEKNNETDKAIARIIRRSNKPILLAINKVDNLAREKDLEEFKRLGNFPQITVSAISGKNTGTLLETIVKKLGSIPNQKKKEADINLAILGRPNAGKSTLLNSLIGQKRAIVSEEPGTTRDSADYIFRYRNKTIRLIDTAGIRQPGKIKKDTIESFSVIRSWQAFRQADIIIVLADGSEGLVSSDIHLIGEAKENGKGVILAVNKIDKWLNPKTQIAKMIQDFQIRLNFAPWLPIVFISGKDELNLKPLLNQVIKINENLNSRIPQEDLDLILRSAKESNFQLKNLIKLRQKKIKPTVFELTFEGKNPPHLTQTRALENKIRDLHPLSGVPFFVDFKKI
jgi:GTP-binding protein